MPKPAITDLSAELPFKLASIALGKLSIHPSVQRSFVPKYSADMAKDYRPAALRDLWVNQEGKSLLIFEGQHRFNAMKIHFGEGWKLAEAPCRIFDNLPQPILAELCRVLNTGHKWKAIAEFRLDVIAREPVAVAITAILTRLGLRVQEDSTPGTVRAVKALRAVYGWQDGPALLTTALSFLHETWPEERDAHHECMIKGTALFFMKYGEEVDKKAFLHRLSAHNRAVDILGLSRSYARNAGVDVRQGVLSTLVTQYNKGRGGKGKLKVA